MKMEQFSIQRKAPVMETVKINPVALLLKTSPIYNPTFPRSKSRVKRKQKKLSRKNLSKIPFSGPIRMTLQEAI